jgi:hypothetical protein
MMVWAKRQRGAGAPRSGRGWSPALHGSAGLVPDVLSAMLPAMHWSALLLLLAVALPALDLPPSPADVPGIRIWPPPAFTHWPAIAYPDETRNAAVGVPVQTRGAKAEWNWEGETPIPLQLPDDVDQTSGLVELGLKPGLRHLRVALPSGEQRLGLRVAPAAAATWPLTRLVDGYPVDEAGVPVVLLASRPQPARERTWALIRKDLPRPEGRPLLVGDPLAAWQDNAWSGLDAETRPATDLVKPHHACLVALATLPQTLPRTVIWCPGNDSIQVGEADPEEVRFLGAVRERFTSLGAQPLLLLALPPRPVEARLQAAHDARREALIAEADRTGWRLLDLARAAGDAETANRVGDNVFTTYPAGEAMGRIRDMLRAALVK